MAHKKAVGPVLPLKKSNLVSVDIEKFIAQPEFRRIAVDRLKEKSNLTLGQFENLGYNLIYRDLCLRLEKKVVDKNEDIVFTYSYILGEKYSHFFPKSKEELFYMEYDKINKFVQKDEKIR